MRYVIIQCPRCDTKSYLSFTDCYEGPFRCWKCRGAFIVRIENEELKRCEPISEEEFEKYIEVTHS